MPELKELEVGYWAVIVDGRTKMVGCRNSCLRYYNALNRIAELEAENASLRIRIELEEGTL